MSSEPLSLFLQKVRKTVPSAARPIAPEGVPEPSDGELMAAIQRGDQQAFEQLFDRYHGLVRGLARRVLKSPEDVADVVQDAFLDVYHRCRSFDPSKGTVRTWICCVAHYRSLKRLRHLRSRDWQSGAPEEGLGLIDLEVNQNHWIRSIDFRKCLDKVLASLNEKQRQTMVLHFFEGRELAVIAVDIGESLANTRHHLYRGLAKLRTELVRNRLLAGYTEFDGSANGEEAQS